MQIEDAELMPHFEQVFFVDATEDDSIIDFLLSLCKPKEGAFFSTHALEPYTVLQLNRDFYEQQPKAFVLAIWVYGLALQNGLSKMGSENLHDALNSLEEFLFTDHALRV